MTETHQATRYSLDDGYGWIPVNNLSFTQGGQRQTSMSLLTTGTSPACISKTVSKYYASTVNLLSGGPAACPGRMHVRLQRFESWVDANETHIIVALSIMAVVIGILPRWTQLSTQSLWTDEQFSYLEATGPYNNLSRMGLTEVHTPFFATLSWLWHRIVGGGAIRLRALSALCGTLAILVTPLLVRRTPLAPTMRWLLTAIAATSGLGFLYSQELRSYGMLWALALVLTLLHLDLDLARPTSSRAQRTSSPRKLLLWAGTAELASATHLFGLILAGCSMLLLLARRRVRVLPGLLLMLAVIVPEAAWLVRGSSVPGFSEGTGWNGTPRSEEIIQLMQNFFPWGRPSIGPGGFYWTSGTGLILAAAFLLVAVRVRIRRTKPHDCPIGGSLPEARAASSLALLGGLVVAAAFLVSQITPLWTMRNLIVADPALRIALTLSVVTACRTRTARTALTSCVLIISSLSMASIAAGNSQPWKTDFRGAANLIVQTRREDPGVRIGGNVSPFWATGTHLDPASPSTKRMFARDYYAKPNLFPAGIRGTGHDTLWIMYTGVSGSNGKLSATMANVVDPNRCSPIHLEGLGAIYCTAESP